jgi:hypothetical protein
MNGVFLAVFVLLQIADVWTTHKALSMGKREANPFLARLFEYFNPVKVMVLVKAVAVIALWYTAYWPLTAALCLLYLWVIDNNLKVIRGTK